MNLARQKAAKALHAALGHLNWDLWEHRLGKAPDPAVAAEIYAATGKVVTRGQVRDARRRRGIPAFKTPLNYDEGPLFFELGMYHDTVLGARYGRSSESICRARNLRGNPAYSGAAPQKARKGIDWDAQDPNEPAKAQALRLGVKIHAVNNARLVRERRKAREQAQ